MPEIRLDIFAHLHQAQLRKTEMEAKNRFEKMGQQAGADITKGIEQASPKIRRAMNSAADAASDFTRKTRDAAKAQQEHNEAVAQGVRIAREMETQQARVNNLTQTSANLERNLSTARREHRDVLRDQIAQEGEINTMRSEHSETMRQIHAVEEKLYDLRAGGSQDAPLIAALEDRLARQRQLSKRQADDLRDAELILGHTREDVGQKTDEVKTFEKELEDVRRQHSSTVSALDSNEKELGKTRERAAKTDADIIKRNDDIERSHRRREESLRRLVEAESDDGGGIGGRRGGGGGRRGGGLLRGVLPGGARAGPGVYGVAAPLAGDLAMGLVTASQSLAVLPAVAAAGAAGLLTLKIGFDGLGQAIKDMGDPKKFAKDLEDLGPAAQQVALEIQHLANGPLGDLKHVIEDSLFKGIPEKVHNLADMLLPPVTKLTTGVGDAFNGMFGNLAGQLTTPESLKSIGDIVNNIVTAFHNLEPAVAPFVDALTKITQTGSNFLPGFGTSIASLAKSFDDFITKAQKSGALQEFMTKGVNALKVFVNELFTLGQKIYEVFGNKSPEQFKSLLDDVVKSLIIIGQVLEEAGKAANVFLQIGQKIADNIGGWPHLIELFGAAIVGVKLVNLMTSLGAVGTLLETGLPNSARRGASGISSALEGIVIPGKLYALGALLGVGAGEAIFNKMGEADRNGAAQIAASSQKMRDDHPGVDLNPASVITGQGSIPGSATPGGPPSLMDIFSGGKPGSSTGSQSLQDILQGGRPGANTTPQAGPPPPIGAGIGPYGGPFDVPAAPDTGPKQSQTDKLRDAMSAMDPSQFMPSVPEGPPDMQGAPGPGSTQQGPLQYGTGNKPYAKPGLGYWNVKDSSVLSAKNSLDREAYDVGQARMKLQALKNIGVTAQEIRDAEENVKEQEASYNEAYLRLTEAQAGTWKKVAEEKKNSKDKLDKLGPGLDADFGIGGGLPGIADNLIRFVATLGMAPVLGALDVMSKGADGKGDGGGSGMFGILGAQNLANGLSPILGQPLGDGSQDSQFPQPAYPEQFPTQSLTGGPGGYTGDAALLSGTPAGRYVNPGGTFDLSKGLADCSSAVGDLVKQMDGQATGGADRLNTGNAASWLTQRGFMPTNTPVPGAFQVGFNSGHMQATLPGGTPFNWGGDTAAANRGIGGSGAWDPEFTSHFYRPAGASGGPSGSPQFGGPSGLSGGGGVVPVFVTNMGGGMLGGGGGPAAGPSAPGQGAGPQPGPGQGGLSPEQWNKIAGAEASGNWQTNSGNGFSGGLQFKPSSWAAAGGTQYAPEAWQASPADQMAAGNRLLAMQGPGAWPATSAAHPDWFKPQGSSPILGAGPTFGAPGPPTAGGGLGPILGGANPLGGPGVGGAAGLGLGASPTLGSAAGQGLTGSSNPSGSPVGRSSNAGGWMPAAGPGLGVGGMAGGALSAAAGAIPGLGQLAQTAMQGINRTISYAGQLGSIGVEGLMETFLPSGSDLGDPQKSWFGRLAAGLAQAKPAAPTSAGKEDEKQQKQRQQQQDSPQQQGGPMVNIENFVQAPNRNGQQTAADIAHRGAEAYTPRKG